MAKVIVNDTTLTSIADAIREAKGTTDTYKPAEMPQAIKGLSEVDDIFYARIVQSNYTSEDVNTILAKAVGKEYYYSKYFSTVCNNISDYAFYCSHIKDLVIPVGYESIGISAFDRCYSISSISLPEGLISIGERAFRQCNVVTEVVFPSTLQTLGMGAFEDDVALEKVTFRGTPTSIGAACFYDSDNLKDIYVPWAEGVVSGAPWGADNATIHYNYKA